MKRSRFSEEQIIAVLKEQNVQHGQTFEWTGNNLRDFAEHVRKKPRIQDGFALPKSLNKGKPQK